MNGDFCNSEGAARLRDMIVDYWRKKGLDVDVQLIQQAFVPAMRSSRTDLRSNMVNGFPKHGAEDHNQDSQSMKIAN